MPLILVKKGRAGSLESQALYHRPLTGAVWKGRAPQPPPSQIARRGLLAARRLLSEDIGLTAGVDRTSSGCAVPPTWRSPTDRARDQTASGARSPRQIHRRYSTERGSLPAS